LDAGCGTGLYCGDLLDRGAEVTAFDPSANMVEIARAKYGDRAHFGVHALEGLLDHYDESSFDVVLSALVLDHVSSLVEAYRQIDAVIKPGGHFVCSFSHPFSSYDRHGQVYFEEERYESTFPNVGLTITEYRRPLDAYIRPLLQAGYRLLDFVETKPIEECKRVHPEAYEKMMKRPTFVALKWRKSG
jgi:2-polyprenyl-3-methyl-5-hydroxy-6-metoxy-1,4-benzoquinol methylase